MRLKTNLITFFILWKINKYKEAKTYITICNDLIREMMRNRSALLLASDKVSKYNLYGIICICVAACQMKLEGGNNFQAQ